MANNILTKQIGPFTGGVWILVIGGGIVLAIVLRKSFGQATPQAVPIIVENVPPKGGAAYSGNPQGLPGGDQALPPPTKPPLPTPPPQPVTPPSTPPGGTPVNPPKPVIALRPTITNFTALPPVITIGQTVVLAWSVIGAKTVTLKRPAGSGTVPPIGTTTAKPGITGGLTYTLVATNDVGSVSQTRTITVNPGAAIGPPTPGAGPSIPGGFSQTCSGVLNTPGDHPADSDAAIVAWMNGYTLGADRGRGRALAWAVEGIGTAKLQSYARYVSTSSVWPLINARRVTRGLRPLSTTDFQALSATLTQQARTGRNSFPDSFVLGLWHTYHLPYLCRNVPRRAGNYRLNV